MNVAAAGPGKLLLDSQHGLQPNRKGKGRLWASCQGLSAPRALAASPGDSQAQRVKMAHQHPPTNVASERESKEAATLLKANATVSRERLVLN